MTDGPAAARQGDGDPCIAIAAQFLANQDGAAERILARHRRSWDGRCHGCGQAQIPWPCVVVVIARHAQDLT